MDKLKRLSKASSLNSGQTPIFLKRLDIKQIYENSTRCEFECTVSGDPLPEIKWLIEDEDLNDNNNTYTTKYDKQSGLVNLIVNNISTINKNQILLTCIASNEYGIAKTIGILIIRPIGALLTSIQWDHRQCEFLELPQSNVQAKEGDDVKLSCKIIGNPEAQVEWFKDGRTLKDDFHIDIYNDRKNNSYYLEICDVKTKDSGEYTVEASNLFNKIKEIIKVNIEENPRSPNTAKKALFRQEFYAYNTRQETYRPPEFITKPILNKVIHEGSNLQITFKVKGVPKPEISWFKNGKPLRQEDDKRFSMYENNDEQYFEINNVSILDTSEYTCTASNFMGAVYSAVNILVEAMTEPETNSCSEIDVSADSDNNNNKDGSIKSKKRQRHSSAQSNDSSLQPTSEKLKKELANQLVEKHVQEHIRRKSSFNRQSDSDKDIQIDECILMKDYKDEQREITLFKGDVLEILDMSKPEKWLVRSKSSLIQVCYIPPDIIQPKSTITNTVEHQYEFKKSVFRSFKYQSSQETLVASQSFKQSVSFKSSSFDENFESVNKKSAMRKIEFQNRRTLSHESDLATKESSSSSEDLKSLSEELEIHFANCDFIPSASANQTESNFISLAENQFVEILDSHDIRYYLVRTRPRKDEKPKIGWVPSCFLEKKSTSIGQVNRRMTRELDKEDLNLINLNDKSQVLTVKRNYSLIQLLNTEEAYIQDLNYIIETHNREKNKLKNENDSNKKNDDNNDDAIFSILNELYSFHNNILLQKLTESEGDVDKLSRAFIDNKNSIQQYYVSYAFSLRQLLHHHLIDYLNRPIDRLAQYKYFLQEQIKYTVRSKQNISQLQEAYFVFCDLFKMIETKSILNNVQGIPTNVLNSFNFDLIYRFDSLNIFDTYNKIKERYCLLLNDTLIILKSKSKHEIGPSYVFTNCLLISSINSIQEKEDDNLSIDLILNSTDTSLIPHDSSILRDDNNKLTLQFKNLNIKLAFVRILKELLRKKQVKDEDLNNKKRKVLPYKRNQERISIFDEKSSNKVRESKLISEEESIKSEVQIHEFKSPASSVVNEDFYSPQYDTESSYHTATGDVDSAESRPIILNKTQQTLITNESESIILECKIKSNPKALIQWFKGDNKFINNSINYMYIEDDTNQTYKLLIRKPMLDDTGIYRVVATNKYGEAVSFYRLVVKSKSNDDESLTAEEQDITVREELKMKGDATQDHDSDNTENDVFEEYEEIVRDTSSVSLLTSKHLDEETQTETTIKKQFVKKLDDFVQTQADLNIYLEIRLNFEAKKVEWSKNGTQVVDLGDFKYEFTSDKESKSHTLVIHECNEFDCGYYTVIIDNELKSDCLVEVVHDYYFEKELAQEILIIDEYLIDDYSNSITLDCQLNIRPTLKPQWFKNNKPLSIDNSKYELVIEHNIFALIIYNLNEQDEGIYKCEYGDKSTECLLMNKLQFEHNLSDKIKINEGESCTLNFKLSKELVYSSRIITKWYKNDIEINLHDDENTFKYWFIENTNERSLIIRNCSSSSNDSGHYKACLIDGLNDQLLLETKTCYLSINEFKEETKLEINNSLVQIRQEEKGIYSVNGVLSRSLKQNDLIQLKQDNKLIASFIGKDFLLLNGLQSFENIQFEFLNENFNIQIDNRMYYWSTESIYTLTIVEFIETQETEQNYNLSEIEFKLPTNEQLNTFSDSPPSCIEYDSKSDKSDDYPLAIECRLNSQLSNQKVKWLKDNKELNLVSGDKYEIIKEGPINSLLIYDLNESDAGIYSCQVNNEVRNTKVIIKKRTIKQVNLNDDNDSDDCSYASSSSGATNFSESPPSIIEYNEDSATSGSESMQPLSIEFRLNRRTKQKIKWFKEDTEINLKENKDKYEIITEGPINSLLIHDLTQYDSGTYKCQIGDGKMRKTNVVVVKRKAKQTLNISQEKYISDNDDKVSIKSSKSILKSEKISKITDESSQLETLKDKAKTQVFYTATKANSDDDLPVAEFKNENVNKQTLSSEIIQNDIKQESLQKAHSLFMTNLIEEKHEEDKLSDITIASIDENTTALTQITPSQSLEVTTGLKTKIYGKYDEDTLSLASDSASEIIQSTPEKSQPNVDIEKEENLTKASIASTKILSKAIDNEYRPQISEVDIMSECSFITGEINTTTVEELHLSPTNVTKNDCLFNAQSIEQKDQFNDKLHELDVQTLTFVDKPFIDIIKDDKATISIEDKMKIFGNYYETELSTGDQSECSSIATLQDESFENGQSIQIKDVSIDLNKVQKQVPIVLNKAKVDSTDDLSEYENQFSRELTNTSKANIQSTEEINLIRDELNKETTLFSVESIQSQDQFNDNLSELSLQTLTKESLETKTIIEEDLNKNEANKVDILAKCLTNIVSETQDSCDSLNMSQPELLNVSVSYTVDSQLNLPQMDKKLTQIQPIDEYISDDHLSDITIVSKQKSFDKVNISNEYDNELEKCKLNRSLVLSKYEEDALSEISISDYDLIRSVSEEHLEIGEQEILENTQVDKQLAISHIDLKNDAFVDDRLSDLSVTTIVKKENKIKEIDIVPEIKLDEAKISQTQVQESIVKESNIELIKIENKEELSSQLFTQEELISPTRKSSAVSDYEEMFKRISKPKQEHRAEIFLLKDLESNLTFTEGEDIFLECISSTEILNYNWFKDDTIIMEEPNKISITQEYVDYLHCYKYVVIINNCSIGDTGRYTFVCDGSIKSESDVVILEPQLKFLKQLDDLVDASESQTIQIECVFNRSVQKLIHLHYEWKKNNKKLYFSNRSLKYKQDIIDDKLVLTIKDLNKQEDEGSYELTITNNNDFSIIKTSTYINIAGNSQLNVAIPKDDQLKEIVPDEIELKKQKRSSSIISLDRKRVSVERTELVVHKNPVEIVRLKEGDELRIQIKLSQSFFINDVRILFNSCDFNIDEHGEEENVEITCQDNKLRLIIKQTEFKRDSGTYKFKLADSSEFEFEVIIDEIRLKIIKDLQNCRLKLLPEELYRLYQEDSTNQHLVKLIESYPRDAQFEVELSKQVKYVEWLINNSKILSNNRFELTNSIDNRKHALLIKACKLNDSGSEIKLKLPNSNITSNAYLKIDELNYDYLVKEIQPLMDVRVSEFDDAVFQYHVQLNSIINKLVAAIWYENDQILNTNESYVDEDLSSNINRYFLKMKKCLKALHKAKYTCQLVFLIKLSNGDEVQIPIKEQSAYLYVREKPIELIKGLEQLNIVLNENDVLELKCILSKHDPSYSWYRNGLRIDTLKAHIEVNETIDGHYEYILKIQTCVKHSDEGIYRFECSKFIVSECNVRINETKLEFKDKLPEIISKEIKNNDEDELRLECSFNKSIIDKLFNINFEWRFNDKRIFYSNKSFKYKQDLNDNKLTLTIKDLNKQDEGIYELKCLVYNNSTRDYDVLKSSTKVSLISESKIEEVASKEEIVELPLNEVIKLTEDSPLDMTIKYNKPLKLNEIKITRNDKELNSKYYSFCEDTYKLNIFIKNCKKTRDDGFYLIKTPNTQYEFQVFIRESQITVIKELNDVNLNILPSEFYHEQPETIKYLIEEQFSNKAVFSLELSKAADNYYWSINGTQVDELDTKSRILVYKSECGKIHELSLSNCDMNDSGCNVEFKLVKSKNNLVTLNQGYIFVNMIYMNKLIKQLNLPRHIKVNENETATINIDLGFSKMFAQLGQNLEYKFYCNDREIRLDDAKYNVSFNSKENSIQLILKINKCSKEDNNCYYMLRVFLPNGELIWELEQPVHVLLIEDKASILKDLPYEKQVNENESVTIDFELNKPNLQVDVFINDKQVDYKNDVENYELKIKKKDDNCYQYLFKIVKCSYAKHNGTLIFKSKDFETSCKLRIKEPLLKFKTYDQDEVDAYEHENVTYTQEFVREIENYDTLEIAIHKNYELIDYSKSKNSNIQVEMNKKGIKFSIKNIKIEQSGDYEITLTRKSDNTKIFSRFCINVKRKLLYNLSEEKEEDISDRERISEEYESEEELTYTEELKYESINVPEFEEINELRTKLDSIIDDLGNKEVKSAIISKEPEEEIVFPLDQQIVYVKENDDLILNVKYSKIIDLGSIFVTLNGKSYESYESKFDKQTFAFTLIIKNSNYENNSGLYEIRTQKTCCKFNVLIEENIKIVQSLSDISMSLLPDKFYKSTSNKGVYKLKIKYPLEATFEVKLNKYRDNAIWSFNGKDKLIDGQFKILSTKDTATYCLTMCDCSRLNPKNTIEFKLPTQNISTKAFLYISKLDQVNLFKITSPLENEYRVKENQSILLKSSFEISPYLAEFINDLDIQVKWFKNDTELDISEVINDDNLKSTSYKIDKAQFTGKPIKYGFQVFINDDSENIILGENNAYVSVEEMVITTAKRLPTNITAYESETVELVCELSEPNLNVDWSKDNKTLSTNNNVSLETKSNIYKAKIVNCTINENGTYTIKYRGKTLSSTDVVVKEPKIDLVKYFPDTIKANEGEDINLELIFSTNIEKKKDLSIEWVMNGRVINLENNMTKYSLKITENRYLLTIMNCSIQDANKYECFIGHYDNVWTIKTKITIIKSKKIVPLEEPKIENIEQEVKVEAKKEPQVPVPKVEDKKEPQVAVTKVEDKKEPQVAVPKVEDKKEPQVAVTKIETKKESPIAVPKVEGKKEPLVAVPKVEDKKEPPVDVPKVEDKKEPLVAVPKVEDKKEPPVDVQKVEDKKEPQVAVTKIETKKESPAAVPKVEDKKEPLVAVTKIETKKESPVDVPKVEDKKEPPVAVPKVEAKKEPQVAVTKIETKKESPAAVPKVEDKKEPLVAVTKIETKKESPVAVPKVEDKKEPQVAVTKIEAKKEPQVAVPKVEDKKEPHTTQQNKTNTKEVDTNAFSAAISETKDATINKKSKVEVSETCCQTKELATIPKNVSMNQEVKQVGVDSKIKPKELKFETIFYPELIAVIGQQAVFECSFNITIEDDKDLEFHWFKNDKKMVFSFKYNKHEWILNDKSYKLIINNCNLIDEGVYHLKIYDSRIKKDLLEAIVRLSVKPDVKELDKKTADLKCKLVTAEIFEKTKQGPNSFKEDIEKKEDNVKVSKIIKEDDSKKIVQEKKSVVSHEIVENKKISKQETKIVSIEEEKVKYPKNLAKDGSNIAREVIKADVIMEADDKVEKVTDIKVEKAKKPVEIKKDQQSDNLQITVNEKKVEKLPETVKDGDKKKVEEQKVEKSFKAKDPGITIEENKMQENIKKIEAKKSDLKEGKDIEEKVQIISEQKILTETLKVEASKDEVKNFDKSKVEEKKTENLVKLAANKAIVEEKKIVDQKDATEAKNTKITVNEKKKDDLRKELKLEIAEIFKNNITTKKSEEVTFNIKFSNIIESISQSLKYTLKLNSKEINIDNKKYRTKVSGQNLNFFISNCDITDSGSYDLVISDSKNETNSCSVQFKVLVVSQGLRITRSFPDFVYAKLNEDISVDCSLESDISKDMLDFNLFINQTKVFLSERYVLEYNQKDNRLVFLIKNCDQNDIGTYEIRINDKHSQEQNVYLTFKLKLIIPKEEDTIEESSYVEQYSIDEGDTAKLFFKLQDVQQEDIFVIYKSNFDFNDSDLKISLNDLENASLYSLVELNDRIVYSLSKIDESIHLQIHDTKLSDTGLYVCKIKRGNRIRLLKSNLKINKFSLKFVDAFQSQQILQLGKELVLSCTLNKIKDDLLKKLKLQLNSKEISVDKHFDKIDLDGNKIKFCINRVGYEHAGEYLLTITNEDASKDTISCLVSIQKPKETQLKPKITIISDDTMTIPIGSSLSLRTHIENVTECTVKWYHNDTNEIAADDVHYFIDLSKDEKVNNLYISELKINSSCEYDEGNYSCKLFASTGTYESHRVTVKIDKSIKDEEIVEQKEETVKQKTQDEPQFITKVQDCNVIENKMGLFECIVSGKPFPQVTILIDNRDIPVINSEKYKLEVDQVTGKVSFQILNCTKALDETEYTIKIENEHGYLTSSAYLFIEKEQEEVLVKEEEDEKALVDSYELNPPTNLTIHELEDSNYELKWSKIELNNVKYTIELMNSTTKVWSVFKSNLQSNHLIILSNEIDLKRIVSFRIRIEYNNELSEPSETVSLYPKINEESSHTGLSSLGVIENIPKIYGSKRETYYYVEKTKLSIKFNILGNPNPNVKWIFNNIELNSDNKKYLLTSNKLKGEYELEFLSPNDSDEGVYKIIYWNEHGQNEHVFRLYRSDPPIFIEPLKETLTISKFKQVNLTLKVNGIPYPEVKFYKDWHLLSESSRIKIQHIKPDIWILSINSCIDKDTGLYSCVAKNQAGSTHCSCMLKIDDSIILNNYNDNMIYPNINNRFSTYSFKKSFKKDFKIIEKLSSDEYYAYYRVESIQNNKEYIAKTCLKKDYSSEFKNEIACLNKIPNEISDLHDVYELNDGNFIILFEKSNSMSLIEYLLRQKQELNERKVALIIRNLLETLLKLHELNVAHLNLTVHNIRITKEGKIKLLCYDNAQYIKYNYLIKTIRINETSIEFQPPEILLKKELTLNTDSWFIGIITYVLLYGQSPFYDQSLPQNTTSNIINLKYTFPPIGKTQISLQAKDFITKLLQLNSFNRLSIKQALNHAWITNSYHKYHQNSINIFNLKQLNSRFVYEKLQATKQNQDTTEIELLDDETDESLSYKLNSFLLPIDDASFAIRLRQYDSSFIHKAPKERLSVLRSLGRGMSLPRMNTPSKDVISNSRAISLTRSSQSPSLSLTQSKEQFLNSNAWSSNSLPAFKKKLQNKSFTVGQTVKLTCAVEGSPAPSTCWFKNDHLISADYSRIEFNQENNGQVSLIIRKANISDIGLYKCEARNKHGIAYSKALVQIASEPDPPSRPLITYLGSSRCYLVWNRPKFDGNSPIMCYKIEYKRPIGDLFWKVACYSQIEECLVDGLSPMTSYRFRISALNAIGSSRFSFASEEIQTKLNDDNEVITIDSQLANDLLDNQQKIINEYEKAKLNVSNYELNETTNQYESKLLLNTFSTEDPNRKYSKDRLVLNKGSIRVYSSNNKTNLLKTVQDTSLNFYENEIKFQTHDRILELIEGFNNSNEITLVYSHSMPILDFIGLRRMYSDELVTDILRQLVDATQWIHMRNYLHLNINPLSIFNSNTNYVDIKLSGFECSIDNSFKSKIHLNKVQSNAYMMEFLAPELLNETNENDSLCYSYASDIWSIGVFTSLLLSGTLFKEKDDILYRRLCFNEFYENVSSESIDFIFKCLKLSQFNRLTINQCIEHKYLQLQSNNMKRRENLFPTDKLRLLNKKLKATI